MWTWSSGRSSSKCLQLVTCLPYQHCGRHTINQIVTVPSLMHQLLNHPDFSKVDLNGLESVNVGANRLRGDFGRTSESREGDAPFLTEGTRVLSLGAPNLTVRPGGDLPEDAFLDPSREHSISERAVQTLIAIAEPFHGMFRDLVEPRRSSKGRLPPDVNTRGAGEADLCEENEMFHHDLAITVGNPDDLLSHSDRFTPGSGPGIRQGHQDRRLL